jgi:hypothetical protein
MRLREKFGGNENRSHNQKSVASFLEAFDEIQRNRPH